MNRRQFLQHAAQGAGIGALALSAPSVLSGCGREEESYKFWHHGNYPPVAEEITETDLVVEGSIPPELSGLYVRNGPNATEGLPDHFFGGDGMLHGVRLERGRAKWYRNRWVETPLLAGEGGVGMPGLENTTSAVSLIHHGGRLLSLGEFGYPYEIDPEDLSTRGYYDYDGKLKANHTAHPRVDPATGELLFFGYNVRQPYLTYMRANAAGELVQVVPIETSGPAMMHDFAATERFVIFMEMPILFSWRLALTGDGLPFRWDDDAVCRFGVMPRTGTAADLRWFDLPPCFTFHVMNSFEHGEEVVVDAARYERLWVSDASDFDHPAYLTRFRLNLASGTATEERLADRAMEFPQLHRGHWTRPYRYGYSLISDLDRAALGELASDRATGFMKFDLETGSTWSHDLDERYAPNEAFFVPASQSGGAEDDGYLLSFVYDATTRTSDLWIVDAGNLAAEPIARVKLPVRVPQGFHGVWVPDSQLDSARARTS